MFFPSLATIVALLSNIEGAEDPTISLETNSLFINIYLAIIVRLEQRLLQKYLKSFLIRIIYILLITVRVNFQQQ